MRNLKYYIKNLAKLSPIASKSVKKCELENSKHRIRQVCLPEMPCNRMHPPFCLYNFYNPYIEKKQPLLFLLLNIEKSLLLKDVLYLRTLYFSISFSYTFRASGLSIGNGFFPMSFESSNQSIFFSSFFMGSSFQWDIISQSFPQWEGARRLFKKSADWQYPICTSHVRITCRNAS